MNKLIIDKVLILSPHTDDAELGAGGTIIKLLDAGVKVQWLVFSTAEESLSDRFSRNALELEFKKVVKQLGLKEDSFSIYNYKVRYLHESRQDILEILVKQRNEFKPDLVIGPSQNDIHQDHLVVSTEMIRAFKNTSSIISYELPWNHLNFNTQLFVKLSKDIVNKKIALLSNYKTQLDKNRKYFSQEYIKGLACVRGIQANTDYAESFEIIRWLI